MQGDTIINGSSQGTVEYKTTQTALKILSITDPEAYATLQNSTSNFVIGYQDNLQSSTGTQLNGETQPTFVTKGIDVGSKTVDAQGDVTGGTLVRPLTFDEQEKVRDNGGNPKGQTMPISVEAANQKVKLEGNVSIKLNSSMLKDLKQLTITLGHEFGHAAFAVQNPALAYLWSIIGAPDKVGHDKNNPNGQNASSEEEKTRKNYDKASKQVKNEEKNKQ